MNSFENQDKQSFFGIKAKWETTGKWKYFLIGYLMVIFCVGISSMVYFVSQPNVRPMAIARRGGQSTVLVNGRGVGPLTPKNCTKQSDCGQHAECVQNPENPLVPTDRVCECDSGWLHDTDELGFCNYEQRKQLNSFLASFFGGWVGADWFYLARGDGGYIAAGVFKLLTVGGVGIWWIVDWARILAEDFADGNGVELLSW